MLAILRCITRGRRPAGPLKPAMILVYPWRGQQHTVRTSRTHPVFRPGNRRTITWAWDCAAAHPGLPSGRGHGLVHVDHDSMERADAETTIAPLTVSSGRSSPGRWP